MFGKKETGTVTFYYNSNEMFNDVSLLSAFMAKTWAGTDDGIDAYCITDDEADVYNVCVNQTLPVIHEIVIKLSSGIDDAFNKVVISEGDNDVLEREAGEYIEITINDNGDYNSNVLNIISDTIRDCIKYGVLDEFYSICLNADLQRLSKSKFTANLSLLNKRLFQLKKKAVNSKL